MAAWDGPAVLRGCGVTVLLFLFNQQLPAIFFCGGASLGSKRLCAVLSNTHLVAIHGMVQPVVATSRRLLGSVVVRDVIDSWD